MRANYPEVEYSMESTPFQWLKMKLRQMWSFLNSTSFLMSTATTLLITTGLSLLTSGIVLLVIAGKYFIFLGDSFFVLPIFITAVAVIIFLTSLLGYYGVKLKKYDLVVAYIAILVIILVFEIIITILGFELSDYAYSRRIINYHMFELMKEYKIGYVEGYETEYWDNMQSELKCCGFNGVNDWGSQIPLSCCHIPSGSQTPFQCTYQNLYQTSCRNRLRWMIADFAYAIGVTCAIVTCLQVCFTALYMCIVY
ncbi:leukocyte surface antigen CD53-like [Pararge aegeria]|uniref:leukocyte surface antigen CD53-like n=1 Tax=Pararge aegeria TaxID=116150 RepID=UPI0019CF8C4F|nr:leukocyte surface antigen CD53-like [Pararge aegeria]